MSDSINSLKEKAFAFLSSHSYEFKNSHPSEKLGNFLASNPYTVQDILNLLNSSNSQAKIIGLMLFSASCTLLNFRSEINNLLPKISQILFDDIKVFFLILKI